MSLLRKLDTRFGDNTLWQFIRKGVLNMKMLQKSVLLVLAFALAIAVCGCALGGKKMIGKDAAFQAALEDAGLTSEEVRDIDIELDRTLTSARYEVDFEAGRTEYEYRIDAYTGEILSAITD